jgi:hypothetical protein
MAADAREVAETYFAAIGARDLERIASCWAPDGVDNIVGQAQAHGPDEVRTYFAELFDAVPTSRSRSTTCSQTGIAPPCSGTPRGHSRATPPTGGSLPPAVASL